MFVLILFTIFVFGPCEPLIPILMYPAAKSSVAGMLLVAGVFSVGFLRFSAFTLTGKAARYALVALLVL